MPLSEEDLQFLKRLSEELAETPVPVEQSGPEGEPLRDRARATLQGITAGFGDELTGALGATVGTLAGAPGTWGERYEDIRDAERREQQRFAEANPWENIALQGAGTLATGGLAAAAAPARLTQAATRLPAAARVLGGGGAVGALEAAGRSEAPITSGEFAQEVGLGAGLGAAGGAVGAAAGALGRNVAMPAWRRAMATPKSKARRAMEGVIGPTGADDVADAMARLGPDAVPGDVPQLTDLARVTAPAATAQDLLTSALEGQERSVLQMMDDIATRADINPAAFNRSKREIARAQRQIARDQYDRAYAHPNPVAQYPELLNFIELPKVRRHLKEAYETGVELDLDDLTEVPEVMFDINDPTKLTRIPSWREFDYIQRGLRHMAENTSERDRARYYRGLRRLLNERLDAANQDFRTARHTYAGFSAVQDAMELGKKVLDPSVSVEDVADAVADAGANSGELAALRTGALAQLRNKLKNTRTRNNLTTSLVSTPAQREKLALLIGEDAVEELVDELERTGQQVAARRSMVAGSRTEPSRQAVEALDQSARSGVLAETAMGNYGTAAMNAMRMMLDPGVDLTMRREVGQALTDPVAFNRLMMSTQPGLWSNVGRVPGSLWGGAAAGAAAPTMMNR